jgi:3-oxoacyl-[acyl-carrier-protein] synthase-3
MGTIIEASATATASAHQRSLTVGALELADAAARSCLERADRTAEELDLLINAGVFHDRILSEPAFASLIQEDIGANLGHPATAGHGTFSFDVYNGACGLLTGIHLIDGMLESGTVELGMVVASDMDPEPGVSEGFTFPGVGGAVLLSADNSRAGFTAFQFATFPEFAELFQSSVDWQDEARLGIAGHGRNILTVEIAESYAARALECAESTVRELAGAQALDLGDVDLLVATASVPGFADGLATRLGVPADRVALPPDGLASAHTAAPAVALESAAAPATESTALFVSAGAGITVAVALYRA